MSAGWPVSRLGVHRRRRGPDRSPHASTADPRIRRTPRHWTDIDRHYQALRLEMMALFADIGIACG